MWDCGPYADLYEELDYDYYDIDESLRLPMEFAHNNMKSLMWDIEQGCRAYARSEFDFSDPVGGRFKFNLTLNSWRGSEQATEFLVWMPGDRLRDVRKMPVTSGPRRKILLDGASLTWEEAIARISTTMHAGTP